MDQIQSTTHGIRNPSHVSCYTPSVIVIGQHPTSVVVHLSDFQNAGRTKHLLYFEDFNSWAQNVRALGFLKKVSK